MFAVRIKKDVFLSSEKLNVSNGNIFAWYFSPVADERELASLSWSKAGLRLPLEASTNTKSLPLALKSRYQKKVFETQFGFTLP